MGYLPDKSWPGGEVDKQRRPGPHVRVFYAPADKGDTQVAEIPLTVGRGLVMVEVDGQVVFTNAECKDAGVVDTVEAKASDGK